MTADATQPGPERLIAALQVSLYALLGAIALASLGIALPRAARAQAAAAAPAPGFTYGAALQTQYDSNVQRVPEDGGAGSWVNQASLFAGFDRTYGRQHLTASADIGRVLFKQLPLYNFTQEDLRAGWGMDLPGTVDTQLDVTRSLNLAHFADLNSVRRDVISHTDLHGVVDFPVVSRWRVFVGDDAARQRNSNGTDVPANVDTNEVDAGIGYQTGKENRIDLLARTVRATYPDAQLATQSTLAVSPYRERGADLRVKWKFSGASTLTGRVGYVQRRNDLATFPDFAGAAYDMTYLWQPTARSSLTVLVLRQTGATGDNQYLSSVAHTYRLSPTYAATAKIQVQAQFELSQFDYLPIASAPTRSDSVHSAGLGATWVPRRWITVKIAQTWEQRASSLAVFDYLDRVSSLSLQATF